MSGRLRPLVIQGEGQIGPGTIGGSSFIKNRWTDVW